MARKTLHLSLLATLVPWAAAQTSIVSLVLPAYDAQTIVASIIGVDATATTYFLTCPTGEPSDECGLADGSTVIDGPSVLEWDLGSGYVSAHVSCTKSADVASCTETLSETGHVTQTATVLSQLSDYALPVTITAGLDKLSASGGAATSPTDMASTTGASQAAAPSSTVSTSSSVTEAGTSSTHTGAAPQVTKKVVLMGAAAVAGAMMIL